MEYVPLYRTLVSGLVISGSRRDCTPLLISSAVSNGKLSASLRDILLMNFFSDCADPLASVLRTASVSAKLLPIPVDCCLVAVGDDDVGLLSVIRPPPPLPPLLLSLLLLLLMFSPGETSCKDWQRRSLCFKRRCLWRSCCGPSCPNG